MTTATELILTEKILNILNTNRFLSKDKLTALIVDTVKNLENAVWSEQPQVLSAAPIPPVSKSANRASIAMEAAKAGVVPEGSASLEGTGLEFGKDYKLKTMIYQVTEYKPWNPKNSVKLHCVTNGKGYKAPLSVIQNMLGLPITK